MGTNSIREVIWSLATEEVGLLVNIQFLVTLFFVAMLWVFCIRLHKQEFFRLWAWAWTSFALYFGFGAFALGVAPQWTLLKRLATLAAVEAGFLQIPLLIQGAWSLRTGERPLPWRLGRACGLALGVGAFSFLLSSIHSDQRLIAFCWRTAPRTVSLAAALLLCASEFLRRGRTDRSWAAAAVAAFCLLYASDQVFYSAATVDYLIREPDPLSGGTFGLALLLRPQWLYLDSIYIFGIAMSLVMMLLEGHQHVERALVESDVRGRKIAEANVALQAEIHKRELAERELRSMSLRLMEVEEEERARIGRELHDGMGAQLALVALGIAKLKQQCLRKAQPLVRQMKELEAIVRELGDYVRSVSHLLYSPSLEHFGLESALIDFCSEFAEKSGAHVEFVHAGLSRDLPPKVELCVYRAVQEALHNVQKHSGSTEARVELEVTSGLIQLRVSDKGKGFNPALIACGEGIGLASMAERVRSLGGQFSVQSSPEEGTSVVVSVPISLVSPT